MPMYLTDSQVTAIKRKRGELNLSVLGLSNRLKLSRWTLTNIIMKDHRKVTPATYKKLTDWLVDEYVSEDLKESQSVATQNK